jgi:hypothetical protein
VQVERPREAGFVRRGGRRNRSEDGSLSTGCR